MADKWMDQRDREWRERDWRRSEQYDREGRTPLAGEDRSWAGSADDDRGPYGYESGYEGRYRGGAERRGYTGLGDYNTWEHDGDRSYNRDLERRYRDEMRRPASGGTGGYDYERGYGDAGRGREPHRPMFEEGHRGGDFLQRTGERISSWFSGEGRHRGVGPSSYRRSDERISEDVHQRLTDDPYLDASNIQVEVKDQEVTLSGLVDNREGKHRAEHLIEDLPGVKHVQNNLRVDSGASLTGSGGRGYGSSALEAEMRRAALASDPNNEGASGLSGRTSTGASAERSTGERRGA